MFLRLCTRTPRTTMLSAPVRFAMVVINGQLYSLSDEVLDIGWRDGDGANFAALSQRLDRHVIDFQLQTCRISYGDVDRIVCRELTSHAGFQDLSGVDRI